MRDEISASEDEDEFDQQFESMNWVYHFESDDADTDADEEAEFDEIIATVLEQYLNFQIDNEEVYAVIPNHKSDLIFFDVFSQVINNTIKALVDSGAGISLIRDDIIPAKHRSLIQTCQGKGVVGFNGARSVLSQKITLRCTSGPMAWVDDFYVVEKHSMPRFALQNRRKLWQMGFSFLSILHAFSQILLFLGKPSLQKLGLWSEILNFKRTRLARTTNGNGK